MIRKKLSSIALSLLLGLMALAPSQARETLLLNRDYKFTLGDVSGAEKPQFDDSQWAPASLPHSFSTPYWGENRFHIGYGWYRKTLTINPEWIGKKIYLDFEGVFQECELYVNGKLAGQHKGGYTGFEFDITPFVRAGKNKIAIRVNNYWNPELAPRAGEHVFSGGIYRDVRLVVKDPLHITWYGTFVKTPQVSAESATVQVTTEIKNDGSGKVQGILATAMLDPKGKTVGIVKSPFELSSGETGEITQDFKPLSNPLLWSPEKPNLYRAESRIYKDKELCDTYSTTFGIRSIEFTKDKGFFLNGKHVYLRGANVHQDRAGWGDAVANSAFKRDVSMIKEAGMNFIRGSHYPHDPAFTQACDELGVMYWSEGVFWGIGGFKDDGYWDSAAYPPNPAHRDKFEQSLKNTLHDMIRIHRNHPSVVAWSMGNEIFFTRKEDMDAAKACTQRLIEYSKELDPTRPAAVGGVQREGFDEIGDLAGYNGDGAYVKNPTLPNMVAEYGSVVSHRPGAFAPNLGCLNGQEPFPWRSGEILWCGFHHGSIAGSMGRMGFVDYARLPLRSWYWYRENLSGVKAPEWPQKGTPAALKLTTDRKTLKADGTEDAHLIVTVTDSRGKHIQANPPVTLTIESGPGIFPTGKSITFEPDGNEAAIREGLAAIEFRSSYAGRTKIRATSPGLKEAVIDLVNTGAPAFVPGKSAEWLPVAGEKTNPEEVNRIVDCAKSRPATASATQPGSEPRFANDGDPSTAWKSTLDKNGKAWWRLDLENFYAVSEVTLENIGPDGFVVELTADEGKTWTPVGSGKPGEKKIVLTSDPSKSYGRFLRISWTGNPGTPVSLGELKVMGQAK